MEASGENAHGFRGSGRLLGTLHPIPIHQTLLLNFGSLQEVQTCNPKPFKV